MIIKKFVQGQEIKQIITDLGSLLRVSSDLTGLTTSFDFADVKNDMVEVTPIVILTAKSEGESVFECDNASVVLASNGDLFMSVVGDVTI